MPSSARTRNANKAAPADLAAAISPTRTLCGRNFAFAVRTASDLSDEQRGQIWRMFEASMGELYRASSFGWNPRKKEEEVFDPHSRFVIAHDFTDPTNAEIVAYSTFRFEREDRQDVVYCYELQVSARFRRFGLGRVLIQMLSDIGARWEMSKIMLTVFKANPTAMLFYKAVGFTTDETSPDVSRDSDGGGEGECDYAILSRRTCLHLFA